MRISYCSSDVCSSDLIGYLCYVANFALVGFGLWIVASVLVPGTAISPILLTGAFASSWLIGFVTPGAPAGFGVREVVLSLWLSESMPASTFVVLVLALRIATTLGRSEEHTSELQYLMRNTYS